MDKILLRNITSEGRQVDITVADGLITELVPHSDDYKEAASGVESVDCTGKVAVPGLINMHTHAAMSLMRGVGEDMYLQDWLKHIWEIESKIDSDFVYWGTKVAALEMIKTGTTTFNDHYWHAASGKRATEEMGLRGASCYMFLDSFDKDKAELQKDQCRQMYDETASWSPMTIFTIGIHAIYTVSEQTILWAVDFARKHKLRIHIHVAETETEVADCRKAHGGLTPVEYLDSLGVLGPDVIAAHSLWLTDKDIEILGQRKVNCVHNINSNSKLASGYRFKWKELADAGANVCLGTDGCASSNNLDILETMKTTALFQKAWRQDPSALPLETLLKMATVNGAKALGVKTGKIEVGYSADIQIIDTDNSFFLSPAPFLANYIYSAHSDCVSSLICGGRFVMRDRKVVGENEILKGARKAICKTINI
jgi:5-methylthioadenosine/S-adenosylhomocysteine deaminase